MSVGGRYRVPHGQRHERARGSAAGSADHDGRDRGRTRPRAGHRSAWRARTDPGPPDEREIPGTERFRVPLALLNHGPDQPLVVELNRRHRGCAGADAALLDPHVLVIGDLGPRQVAMMGTDGTLRQTEEVLAACGPDTHVVIPEGLQDDLDPWVAPRPRHTYRVGTNAAGETTLHLSLIHI